MGSLEGKMQGSEKLGFSDETLGLPGAWKRKPLLISLGSCVVG